MNWPLGGYRGVPVPIFLGALCEFSVVHETGGRLAPGMHELQLGMLVHHIEIGDSAVVPPGSVQSTCEALGIDIDDFYVAAQKLSRQIPG